MDKKTQITEEMVSDTRKLPKRIVEEVAGYSKKYDITDDFFHQAALDHYIHLQKQVEIWKKDNPGERYEIKIRIQLVPEEPEEPVVRRHVGFGIIC